MNKKILLSVLVCLLVSAHFYGQILQVSHGTLLQEEHWAVAEDAAQPMNPYIVIGNATTLNGQKKIWISSYSPLCRLVTSSLASNNRDMIARDISIAPPDPANPANHTYYITGITDVNGMNQMFVARIDLNGALLWIKVNPIAFAEAREMEGVAVVTEPVTNDVVVLGITRHNLPPLGAQVVLSRFNPAGVMIWSNIYATPGNWIPREIDLGPGMPQALMGDFVITGEMTETAGALPQTFAARYNGAGAELWRNLYPAIPGFEVHGDAGYDVVYEPVTGNFCVAGVVQTAAVRAAATSTPYILNITPGGLLAASSVYLNPGNTPMGLYPRSVSLGRNAGEVIFAGPHFITGTPGRTFYASLPTIAPPGAGLFADYAWLATANSVPQPFIFYDAQPEDILSTNQLGTPGNIISTNGIPGAFGAGDGHLLRTDALGRTPASCPERLLPHITVSSLTNISITRQEISIPEWVVSDAVKENYPIQELFCETLSPVTLTNFSATKKVNSVLLHWTTSHETRFGHFEVERSIDGTGFVQFASISAAGGTTGMNYTASDDHPVLGMNYYRLKMVNTNGTFIYSNIIKAGFSEKNRVQILPNPATAYFVVTGTEAYNTVQVCELSGSVVRTLKKTINGRYPVSGLSKGLYIIRLTGGEEMITQKLVIQ